MRRRAFITLAAAGALPLFSIARAGTVSPRRIAQTGPLRLDRDGHRVTNNDAANAYTKTTYRPGWELPKI